MGIEDVFQNLTPDEVQSAQAWLEHLRKPEIQRVQDTLRVLNGKEFYLEDLQKRKRTKIAVIAAGSSIKSQTYPDIDLFLLSQNPLHSNVDLDPQAEATLALSKGLPEYVEFILYGKQMIRKELKYSQSMPIDEKIGARVTLSLLYLLFDFKKRRESHPDDLIEPRRPTGAEQFIRYNREQGSKFLVLSRQYPIKT